MTRWDATINPLLDQYHFMDQRDYHEELDVIMDITEDSLDMMRFAIDSDPDNWQAMEIRVIRAHTKTVNIINQLLHTR